MAKRLLPEEFKDFINLLNSNNVKYLLIGGWAVGFYGYPRTTKDIDFLVSNDNNNLKKLEKVFREFNSPPVDIKILKESKSLIFLGTPPNRIEIINSADGIEINDCYTRKKIIKLDDITIKLISKKDLIKGTSKNY